MHQHSKHGYVVRPIDLGHLKRWCFFPVLTLALVLTFFFLTVKKKKLALVLTLCRCCAKPCCAEDLEPTMAEPAWFGPIMPLPFTRTEI
jgi:hypothetical protein